MVIRRFKNIPTTAAVVLLVFALAGVLFLMQSRAATPFVSAEPESGAISSPAAAFNDATASGGKSIKFGPAQTPPRPFKIMPLGDSITGSPGLDGGYRTTLWQRLVQTNGYQVDLVGSMSSGPTTLGDKDNEGHAGWCIDMWCAADQTQTLSYGITGWLATYQPDMILLHAGTNDLKNGTDGATVATRLDAMLGKIFAARPNVRVVVAKNIQMNDAAMDSRRQAYIAAMPNIISKYQAQGRYIKLVDMSTLLTYPADYYDQLHPNSQGYAKMTNVWYPLVADAYNGL